MKAFPPAALLLATLVLSAPALRAKEEIIPTRREGRERQGPTNPLRDVAGDMDLVARRLAEAKTDETTQEVQQRIIEKLDKLIEQARRQSQCPPRGGSGDQPKPKQQQQPQPQPAKQKQSQKTQRQKTAQRQKNKQTQRPGIGRPGSGTPSGPIHTDAQEWGNLPPAVRQQLLNIQGEGFPLKYRELLRRYYRSLLRPRE